jgi:nucleoside-diphosphate-sugar epimerase
VAERRVLVTGSSGGLGRAVTASLFGAGYAVTGADRVAPEPGADGVRHVDWDGRAVSILADAMADCQGLVHLAAIPMPGQHPDEVVFGNNTGATFAALQAAAQAGITRVVIASSISAYGMPWSPTPIRAVYVPVDEDHPMRNHDPYGLSKEVDERTAAMFCRRHSMSVAALRFHWIATREAQLARVAALAEDEDWDAQLKEMWGYIDVRDAAEACRLALDTAADHPFGFVAMNIVAADSLTDASIGDLVAAHAPDIEIRSRERLSSSAFDIRRAREVIGWFPQHSWRD